MSASNKSQVQDLLGMKESKGRVRYLGVMIDGRRKSERNWKGGS